MSDHKFILTNIYKTRVENKAKFIYGETNLVKFNAYFRSEIDNEEANWEQCGRALTNAYKKSTCRVKCDGDYKLPYWWNVTVEEKIKETRKRRRKFQKCKEPNEREKIKEEYKTSKKLLKKVIASSKAEAWDALCKGLESDIYGNAYKIVKSQMQIAYPKTGLTPEQKRDIFKGLFITVWHGGKFTKEAIGDKDFERITFTPEEIRDNAKKIKTKKPLDLTRYHQM